MGNAMGKIIGIVVLALLVIGGVGGCNTYNSLVSAEESVEAAWSQVENVYQRRADLIPNLVETVKGAADFEKSTLESVIQARASATQVQATISEDILNNPEAMQRFEQVQGELSSALSRLMVTVERYPDIKANQNFLALQSQLEGTENRIAVERRKFNEAAQAFNARVRRFPTNVVASMTGFEKKAYFQAQAGAETAPQVDF
jgi:LemA protein